MKQDPSETEEATRIGDEWKTHMESLGEEVALAASRLLPLRPLGGFPQLKLP
jgi:hypothetical protein